MQDEYEKEAGETFQPKYKRDYGPWKLCCARENIATATGIDVNEAIQSATSIASFAKRSVRCG